jgi:hypothetical protein
MAWNRLSFLGNWIPVNGVAAAFALKGTAMRFKMPNEFAAFQAGSND